MKINISEALKDLSENENISSKNHMTVKVELTRHFNGDEDLKWSLYAYDKDSKENEWSENCESFPEALKSLISKLKGEKTYTEE